MPLGTAAAVRVVARREITSRALDKGFVASTAVTLAIVVFAALAPLLFGGDGTTRWTVAVHGQEAVRAGQLLGTVAGDDTEVEVVEAVSVAEGEALVRAGDADALLTGDGELVGDDGVDDRLRAVVSAVWVQQRLLDELTAAGVPDERAATVLDAPPPAVRLLDPLDDGEAEGLAIVGIGVLVLFGQIFGFGFWVASGVVEEKQSRVVEVLMAKLRPRTLLAGKVIGLGLLGIAQLVLTLGAGLLVIAVTGSVDLPGFVARSAVELAVWFVLGYLLYASAFAMAGSIASRVEDLQNSSGPLTLVLMGSFVGSTFALADPEGTFATVLSFLPTSAPLTMPVRSAAGVAAWWEVLLSAAITLVSAALLVRLAGRVYAGAALRTSGPVKMREALKAASS